MFGRKRVASRAHKRAAPVVAAVSASVSVIAAVIAISTSSGGAETSPFTFGTAFAQASLLTPALNAGELSVPIILGESASGYQDETGRATSTLGAVPLLGATGGGGTTCGVKGGAVTLPLPPPLSADTSSKQNRGNVDESKASGNGLVQQEVHATPRSSGRSLTQLTNLALPDVATFAGAKATTSAMADQTALTRRSEANTSISDVALFGGLVTFKGMRWSLVQTATGADSRTSKASSTWSFGLDGITIDPTATSTLPLPKGLVPPINLPIASPAEAAAVVKTANATLETLGVTIHLPEFQDNGQGRLTVSPLRVDVGGPNWVLTPVFGKVVSQPRLTSLQTAMFKFLFDPTNCDELLGALKPFADVNAKWNSLGATAPLLAAAGVGVLSGGSASLSIGGVTTAVDDTYYPTLDFGGPSLFTPGNLGLPSILGQTIFQAPTPVLGATPTVSSRRACSSTSPAGAGCWKGLAPVAAGVAGVVAVGSLVADQIFTRRRAARLAENEVA